jgi:hypothetical protein
MDPRRGAAVNRVPLATLAGLALVASVACADARASEPPTDASAVAAREPAPARADGLEPLVPELSAHPYALDPGVRPYRHRLSFSPGFGYLGAEPLYSVRLGYCPDSWLGYEASLGHNPGQSVHAVLHTLSAIVRRPLPGRFQPYVSAGYGMVMVFPGRSLNASPVTKNAVALGGGLEFFIRSDLALRGDLRHATVFGKQRDREGIVAYQYLQSTVALAFYRSIRP